MTIIIINSNSAPDFDPSKLMAGGGMGGMMGGMGGMMGGGMGGGPVMFFVDLSPREDGKPWTKHRISQLSVKYKEVSLLFHPSPLSFLFLLLTS